MLMLTSFYIVGLNWSAVVVLGTGCGGKSYPVDVSFGFEMSFYSLPSASRGEAVGGVGGVARLSGCARQERASQLHL